MWYPLIEIVLKRGVNFDQNSNVSMTSRIDGAGG